MNTTNTLLEQNLLKLNKESFNIKFNLENTKYEAIENIGTGAYGVVCKAINKKTKEKVAIKKIPGAFDCFLIAKRTYREIKILKHLKHDNIISIKDIIQPDDNLNLNEFKDVYVVFDLMESDLHRVIHSKQTLSDDHVKYFLYQIIKALKYIHSAKIIHRDLKPSNILVNENCDLKIGDFGMSRSVNITEDEIKKYNLTQYVATRWYRAPELIYACEYTSAIDLWSVGCILSEMITYKPLFPCKDALSLIKLIFGILGLPNKQFIKTIESELFRNLIYAASTKSLNKKVNFRDFYPNLSDEGFDLLTKLLSIDPKQRLTANEVLEHPYLVKYRDPITETTAISPLDFDFEKKSFMIQDGSNENLYELKKEILREAEDYIKKPSNKLSLNIESLNDTKNAIENEKKDLVDENDDVTNAILKIDEFLGNLDTSDNSRDEFKITSYADESQFSFASVESNDSIMLNKETRMQNSTTTSTTAKSNIKTASAFALNDDSKNDCIILDNIVNCSNVKSILKQKLLDSAAKKASLKDVKNKTKTRHLNSNKVLMKPKVEETNSSHKAMRKDIPIRPKPAVAGPNNASLMMQPQQIYIHSNQPIIILNASALMPTNNQATLHPTAMSTANNTNPITFLSNPTISQPIKTRAIESNSKLNLINVNTCNHQPTTIMQQQQSVDDLTKLLSKYKVNDTNSLSMNSNEPPVSLIVTPRGTADGYSIGIDYDNLVTEIPGYSKNFNILDDLDSIILQSLDNNDLNRNNSTNNNNNSSNRINTNNSTQHNQNLNAHLVDNIDLSNILDKLDSPMIFSPINFK